MKRPDFIKHYTEIQNAQADHYPGSDEPLSQSSPFGWHFGLDRIGVNYEVLAPGRRTSWPHAEKTEEELIFVLSGTPQVWVDGVLHDLRPGDAVGFPAGTGISHTFINNTDRDVHLLVVGEHRKADNQVFYPLNPERRAQVGDSWWEDVPERPLGDHDGLPDALRAKRSREG